MSRFIQIKNGILSKITNIKLPQKLKGGRIEKWADYWIIVGRDYREAFIDVAKGSKEKPSKALFYLTVLYGMSYAVVTNPDETDYRDALQRHMNDSALLSNKIRNPEVDNYFNFLVDCFNHDLVRRLSIGFASFLWIDNYSKACASYKARCSYLKPRYITFHERIVDIGCFGIWWRLKMKFQDFDVNPNEWSINNIQRFSSSLPIETEAKYS